LKRAAGNTNTTGAMRVGRDLLSRAAAAAGATSRKRFVILLTDGANNVDGDPVKEARLLKQDGLRLITVGISHVRGGRVRIRVVHGLG